MILGAVMGAGYEAEKTRARRETIEMQTQAAQAARPRAATQSAYVRVENPILRPVPAARDHASDAHTYASAFAHVRPGERPDPDLAWPVSPMSYANGYRASTADAAFDLANNNTAPAAEAEPRFADATSVDASSAGVNDRETLSEGGLETPTPHAPRPQPGSSDPSEEDIAVEQISGWYARKNSVS